MRQKIRHQHNRSDMTTSTDTTHGSAMTDLSSLTLTAKMKTALRWLLLHHVDYVKWCLNQIALHRLGERQHHHRGFAHIHQLSWTNRTTFIGYTRSTIDRFTHHHSDVSNDALPIFRCAPTADLATNGEETTNSNDENRPPQLQEITAAEAMLTRLISPPLMNDTSRSDRKWDAATTN